VFLNKKYKNNVRKNADLAGTVIRYTCEESAADAKAVRAASCTIWFPVYIKNI